MKYLINSDYLSKSISALFIAFAIFSCSPPTEQKNNTTEAETSSDTVQSVETTRTRLVISENSFRGIKVGDEIATHLDYIKKDKLKTGEGEFDIYTIKDFNNNPAGYLFADPNNEKLVGDITIKTKMAETEAGVKVGDSFQVLKTKIPAIKVHGSEIEGRTYARDKTISYRLNTANFTYDVAIDKIPLETTITEIVINRK